MIAELDIYVAFAQVAVGSQSEYIRPKLHEMGSFKQKDFYEIDK